MKRLIFFSAILISSMIGTEVSTDLTVKAEPRACKRVVTVATIDTGIDLSNNELRGRIKTDEFGSILGSSFGSLSSVNDVHGHGTHIADLITREDECIKIIPFSYYIDPIFAPFFSADDSFYSALVAAINSKPDLINISGGGYGSSVKELLAIREAESLGILIVAAAGNHGKNLDQPENGFFPSSYKTNNILTVGALTEKGDYFQISNYGKAVDISTVGEMVVAAGLNNKQVPSSGTSQATATISGVIAKAMLINGTISGIEMKKLLLDTANKNKSLEDKINEGRVLNKEEFLLSVSTLDRIQPGRSIASNSTLKTP